MEKKGRTIFRIFMVVLILAVISGTIGYGYRWHANALADRDAVCAAQTIEDQKTQEKQDRKVGRLIDQLHMDGTSYKLEAFVGGVRIRLLNNTEMYFEARKGSEDVTVHFTAVTSPATK